jgi:hypothetical protein
MAARSKRKLIIGIFGLGVAGMIALVFYIMASSSKDVSPVSKGDLTGPQIEEKTEKSAGTSTEKVVPAEPSDKTVNLPEESFEQNDEAFIQNLREKYKNTIHNKWSQTKAIEKLMEYLEKFYPDDWESHVLDFFKRMFPELADELYAQFQKNMTYRQWLIDNRQELNMLSREDRRDRLWDMRYQIFGEDAYEIWEVELKTEQIYESLQQINEQPDAPFEEKYATYLGAVKQAYGDTSDRFIEKRRQELMDRFLAVETVQDDLYEMPAQERNQKLREFRKSMGLDEEALKRWEQLDQERDTEWDKGTKYMTARDEIAAKYEGDEQVQKLQALREEVFGSDWAEIIKNEEESGFHRFKEKRKLGME